MIGVFGAVNTPPLSKKGRLDQEKLVFSYTQDVTVGGVEYKVYRPDPAVWATITKALSKDGSGYRKTERFDAWGRWHKLMQSDRAYAIYSGPAWQRRWAGGRAHVGAEDPAEDPKDSHSA